MIELIGVVEESFPNTTFRVRVLSKKALNHELLCHLAGRMRLYRVRILPGDRVRVEMTPYDLEKGRIVYRYRTDDDIPELRETVEEPKAETEEASESPGTPSSESSP